MGYPFNIDHQIFQHRGSPDKHHLASFHVGQTDFTQAKYQRVYAWLRDESPELGDDYISARLGLLLTGVLRLCRSADR